MKEIVIATRNPGKLEEFKVLMKDLEVELRSLEEWPNVPEPEETGLPCIADDSGLEVLALEGAPGVRSSRYAGEEATDEENNKLLLQTMKFQVKRTCRFRCALAVAAPNGKILLESDGICDGMLLHEPLGTEGFGYDPLFWSTELHKGMGEATMQEKNKISHRGKAIKKLVANWGKMK